MPESTGHHRRLRDLPDTDLARRARRGDKAAFEVLLARHQTPLFTFLARWLRDPDAAQEVLQRAAVRSFEKLDRFDLSRAFKPWLYAVAVNEARGFVRSRKLRLEREGRFARQEPDSDPGTSEKRFDAIRLLETGLRSLSGADRQILLLRFAEELSVVEVANILRVPGFVVKMRTLRARRRFRAAIQRLSEKPA